MKLRSTDTFAAAAEGLHRAALQVQRAWLAEEQARLLGLRPKEDGSLELIPQGAMPSAGATSCWMAINEDDIYKVIDQARLKGVPGLKKKKTSGPSPILGQGHACCAVKDVQLAGREAAHQSKCKSSK